MEPLNDLEWQNNIISIFKLKQYNDRDKYNLALAVTCFFFAFYPMGGSLIGSILKVFRCTQAKILIKMNHNCQEFLYCF